jgi:hypothetical protein
MSTTHIARWQVAALATLIATTLSAGPASAVMLHGPALPALSTSSAPTRTDHPCWLSRVGTQLVRCDNLTGDAVPAPRWLPQR